MRDRWPERAVEQYLSEGVKALGGRSYKFVSPGQAGVPDRLVVWPGGAVEFVELKAEGGRLSKTQERQLWHLLKLGASAEVVTGRQGVRAWLEKRAERYGL